MPCCGVRSLTVVAFQILSVCHSLRAGDLTAMQPQFTRSSIYFPQGEHSNVEQTLLHHVSVYNRCVDSSRGVCALTRAV